MDSPVIATSDPLDASFDIVARQDQTEAAVTVLRSDVDEVKARLGRYLSSPSNAGRLHPQAWLSSHKLGRAVALAVHCSRPGLFPACAAG